MSWNWNSHGLPFLPGNTFRDVTKSSFHRPQTLSYRCGYALPRRPVAGIGQDPLVSAQLMQQQESESSFETPDIWPARSDPFDKGLSKEFVPAYVAFDKKVLRFFAYFQEDTSSSPEEAYRVRPVIVYYYLEDDSMCIFEPTVKNSGIPQGKLLKRHRFPKNERGEHYLWKDLNVGMDLQVYGIKYHITQCDAFTEDFMESQGIVLKEPQQMPADPYIKRRENPLPCTTKPPESDSMQQFLTMDRKVLRFFALWDDDDGETKPVTVQFYLVDDTVEVREVHKPNSGRDPFPILMRRQRLHKTLKPKPFPSCVLELSTEDVNEFYSPKDFQLGQTLTLLSRRFLLYDCDGFTKEYYLTHHPDVEMKPSEIPNKVEDVHRDRRRLPQIPPYNGYGSLEDSLQNCLSLIPKPPRKNVLKMLENDHKVLRYGAILDSQNPEDEGRRFVLSYHLSNDMISIYEKPTRNSGILAGKFLEKTRVPKLGSTVENPQLYSPVDLVIGATVEVFGHRFVLTDAAPFVLSYLESISSQVPSQTLDLMRQKLGGETLADRQPGGEAAELSS
ncbi:hypothetical protein JOB18_008876 [Solea senegalensis]|uniref:DM10 domain-containing protein n=1 Tax=Solea senegalensis TaxID=28829 RepID=A0AAV6RVS0_SOLSE|nr:EF-hand domain-containing protein 1-like [Solea senegalensis]XP_043904499.1 EF-hand domain-containing protein 1-like [Solea senegalensis]KAG7508744.1 hypothetical protein JOB18_022950 [Solea senegalensis]KAG7517483.1 hypothetical protein JOB18_008876 [Solea senegalensis]